MNKQQINYDLAASQFIKALRGNESQRLINAKMNFTVNQVYRWESGYNKISWVDFVDYCSTLNIPLARELNAELGYDGDLKNTPALVKHIAGSLSIEEVRKATGLSRSTLSKLLHQKTKTKLVHILVLMDRVMDSLINFVHRFIDPSKLSALKAMAEAQQKFLVLVHENIEAPLLLACFSLPNYIKLKKHSDNWCSRQTGIPEKDISTLLVKMLKTGYVIKNKGKYTAVSDVFNMRFFDLKSEYKTKKFWIEKSLPVTEKQTDYSPKQRSMYLLYPASHEADLKIRKATFEFLTTLNNIVSNDHNDTKFIRLLNFQDVKLQQE